MKEIALLLINRGAKISGIDKKTGAILACAAAEIGDAECLQRILECGIATNALDTSNSTPMHYAANFGQLATIKNLQSRCGNMTQANTANITPLHYAAFSGHLDVVKYLCMQYQGAELSALLNAASDRGITPLHAAILGRHDNTAIELIRKHANLTLSTRTGFSALHLATLLNCPAIVDSLLTITGPTLDPNIPDIHGRGALHYASHAGNLAKVSCLLNHGAQPTNKDKDDKPAIEYTLNEEIRDLLTFWTTLIPLTVADHSKPSPDDPTSLEPKDIALIDQTLCIEGKILPSLQQIRPNGKVTLMCGYYALYNAACLIDPTLQTTPHVRMDRNEFGKFLTKAIETVRQLHPYGAIDNLTAHDIRILISTHYNKLPIVVIEKDCLLSFINHNEASLETMLEIDEEHDFLRKFVEPGPNQINQVALIVGTGSGDCGAHNGHWFTIIATRENGTIKVYVADSMRSPKNYDTQACSLNVLPIYYILTNDMSRWKALFTDDLKNETFNITPRPSTNITQSALPGAVRLLENFIESIQKINTMFAIFLEDKLPEPATNKKNIFLVNRYITKFVSIVDDLLSQVGAFGARTQATNPLGEKIFELENSIITNITSQSETILNIYREHGRNRNTMYALHQSIITSITKLRELERKALEINKEIKALHIPSSNDNENMSDFTMPMASIDKGLYIMVMNAAPSAIEGIIGMIARGRREPLRILFVGPPGNGKTTLAQAIAQTIRRPCILISTAGLGTRFQFSREEQLTKLKRYIKANPKSVIIFDELDSIKDSKDDVQRTAEMLQIIIDNSPETLFIGTTNYKDLLPAPLLSRFNQNVIKIDNPDETNRLAIIQHYCTTKSNGGLSIKLSEPYKRQLAKATKSFSIRDINSMFTKAIEQAYIPDGKALYNTQEQSAEDIMTTSATATSTTVLNQKHMEVAFQSEYDTITKKYSKTKIALAGLETLTSLGIGVASFTPWAPIAIPVATALHAGAKIARATHARCTAEGKEEEARAESDLNQTLRDSGATATQFAQSELAHQRQIAIHKEGMAHQDYLAERAEDFQERLEATRQRLAREAEDRTMHNNLVVHNNTVGYENLYIRGDKIVSKETRDEIDKDWSLWVANILQGKNQQTQLQHQINSSSVEIQQKFKIFSEQIKEIQISHKPTFKELQELTDRLNSGTRLVEKIVCPPEPRKWWS